MILLFFFLIVLLLFFNYIIFMVIGMIIDQTIAIMLAIRNLFNGILSTLMSINRSMRLLVITLFNIIIRFSNELFFFLLQFIIQLLVQIIRLGNFRRKVQILLNWVELFSWYLRCN
ncbi:hypothetical protein PPERSA_08075 [Pseudocohnilembus persalinus]|uniref:Uncharacterized protein n=1 Tax=Pseudocohnilembus persalinus TaxID=266149 RepID=A0A0V0R2L3_PSEPJ|nr:hypothetical protein PPERSA_08075 [Pseudocohnilembus persalinus]|eukprot:KRX08764.1 hypothetical protein PPERSA_08075 [Pseudocohnilembus persalinus]